MAGIVGFEPDQPEIVGFEPDQSLGQAISTGFQNIVPELKGYASSEQGMPLQQAVAKARGDFQEGVGLDQPEVLGLNATTSPVSGSGIPEIAQAVQNIPETWKGVKNYIATKPIESIGQAALMLTPLPKGLGLAEKAAAAPERIAPELSPLEQGTIMKGEGGAGIQASKDSGATIPASEAQGLLDQIKTDTASEYNPFRHTSAKAFFKKFQSLLPSQAASKATEISDDLMVGGKRLGSFDPATKARIKAQIRLQGPISGPIAPEATLSVKDLHNMRQDLNDVFKSPYEQEKMLAGKAKDAIDDVIVKKMDQGEWNNDMRKYAIGSTVQELSRIADRAEYRTTQLQAGNKEQALNTEFRQWARPKPDGKPNRNMRMLRALSPDAADKMEAFVKDKDPARKLLRGLGSMAPRNIQSFSWDHIGALLFHTVLGVHLNPYMLMGIGAGAKYLAGGMAEKSLQGIQKALLEAEKISDVEGLISPDVLAATAKNPGGKQALKMWANAKGPAKKYAASVLARQVAMAAKAPQHVPRIEKEINDLNENEISKTNRVETNY